jgi:hypothetical protein
VSEVFFFKPHACARDADLFYIHHVTGPQTIGSWSPFVTSLIDLTQSESAIFQSFNATTRKQIRRAEQTDGFTYTGPDSDSDTVKHFLHFLRTHGRGKIAPPSRGRLRSLIDSELIALTSARDAADNVLVWHAYIVSASRARQFYAVRTSDSVDRATVGRANRWCFWRDIQLFRAAGFARYDLGGLPRPEQDRHLRGVTQFKLGFGGSLVQEYSGVVPLSRRGNLILGLRALRPRDTISWAVDLAKN